MPPKRFEFPPMLGPPDEEPHGSPAWAMRVAHRVEMYVEKVDQFGVDHLCRYLTKIFKEPVLPWDIWPDGAPCQTLDAFFQLSSGRTFDQIRALIADYLGNDALTRQLDAAKARADDRHVRQGRPRKDMPENRAVSTTSRGSTNAAHLLRRIARKRPDVLERYDRGEFHSVRAAADAAGLPRGDSPAAVIRRAWKKLSKEERAILRAELPD